MTLVLPLLFSAGLLLGLLFFGGLWLTLQRLPTADYPALLVMTSLLTRTLIASAGFYFLMDASWQRLVAALLGFITARLVLTRVLRRSVLE